MGTLGCQRNSRPPGTGMRARVDLAQMFDVDVRVALGRRQRRVAEEFLDSTEIPATGE